MKRLIIFLWLLLCTAFLFGQTNPNHVYVKGYYRTDGTYVKGHYRTAPNSTNRDNFSTKGNYNPYTGKAGWIEPDKKTENSYSTYSYPSTNSSSSAKYIGTTNSSGQKVITYSNGREVFGLCKDCRYVTYKESLYYYSYNPYTGIQKTKGDSGGTLLDGEYKFYNEKGKLLIKSNYRKGVKHGNHIIWNEQGDIEEKANYTNGLMDYAKFTNDKGHIIEWHGRPLVKGSVKKIYTLYGTLIQQVIQLDDLKIEITNYYNNGKIKDTYTTDYVDRMYNKYISYYWNGNIEIEGQYEDNSRSGEWKWYNEDGSLSFSELYRINTIYYENGNLKAKGGEFFNPESQKWIKNGKWIFYDENGKWDDLKRYEYGVEIKKEKE